MPKKRTRQRPLRSTAAPGVENSEVPRALRGFVRARVKSGGFDSVADYLRHVVEEDKRAVLAARRHINRLIREGEQSGSPLPMDADYWARKVASNHARPPRARRVG